MKTKKWLTGISLLLSLGMALSALNVHAKPEHQGKHKLKTLFHQLALSEQQRQDVKLYLTQHKSAAKANRGDSGIIHEQMQQLMQNSEFDEELATNILQQRSEKMLAHAWQRALVHQKIWSVLNDEQRAKWKNLVANEQSNKHAHKRPQKGEWLAKLLNLNAEQNAAISEIKQQQASLHQQLHQLKQSLRASELSLIESDNLTEERWQEQITESQSTLLNLQLTLAKLRYEQHQLLTPEQQQILAEKRAQWGKDHQHHKGQHPKPIA